MRPEATLFRSRNGPPHGVEVRKAKQNTGPPWEACPLTAPQAAPLRLKRGHHIATRFPAPDFKPKPYTYRWCSAWVGYLVPENGSSYEDRVCDAAAQLGERSKNGHQRESRFPGVALRTSKPWGGPSQRGVWVSSVAAAKTTLPCHLKGSAASLKCCWRFAPRGVDRIGSLEMLIFSEFEASEPRLRACCAGII